MSTKITIAENSTAPAVTHKQGVEEPRTTVITPDAGWRLFDGQELWRYRELLFFLCWRDVKIRYKQTFLGAAWAILQPALLMVVFSMFFGKLGGTAASDIPYSLFVCAGLLPWTFFATALQNSANSVVGSERLITKIYFPRLLLPFSSVGAALVDLLVSIGLLFVMMVWHRFVPPWTILLLPIFVFGIALTATGLGTLLSALNVNYRDFRYVIPFMVQVGLFATPTIYMDVSTLGATWHNWLWLNPLAGFIAGFRGAALGTEIPWGEVAISFAMAAIFFVIGCLYFRRVEDTFADNI